MATTPVLPKLIGQRVKRREDPRLIQGGATYVDDLKIAGMQYVVFKRSDVAHGDIDDHPASLLEHLAGRLSHLAVGPLGEFARIVFGACTLR